MEFRESEAIQYGVNEAIMIQNFRYWINKNKANEKHEYEGKTWTYNSRKAFKEIFPFWSDEQIKRILNSLVSKNIIQKGNFNKVGFDRTTWYSFIDEERFLSVGPNEPIHWVKSTNALGEINQPIPDSIPYSIPNNKKEKNIKKKKEFIPPTLEEVKAYCKERNNNVDAEKFYDYYAVADWKNKEGKPVRNWKQTVISWEGRNNNTSSKPQKESKPYYECVNPNVSYDYDDYDEGIR